MSIKRERSKLYRLAYGLQLHTGHFRAACILLDVVGYEGAERFLNNCGMDKTKRTDTGQYVMPGFFEDEN